MPPKVKFQKEEIVRAALNVAREKGMDAVTAREVAASLNVSPRPIFTYYDTMDQLRRDVFDMAKEEYRAYIEKGLAAPIPFLGVGQQYVRFAREEPELYRLLFLTRPDGAVGGAMEALKFTQDLVRESLMRIYRMDAHAADCYFRDLWLMAFSFATLIVKAYKEIPGLVDGTCDKDAIFRQLVEK